MAKEEFLENLRRARNLFVHARSENGSGPASAAESPGDVRAAIWLTPRSVAGFEPTDFVDLPDESRARLTSAVGDFLAAAPLSGAPANPDQISRGRDALAKILDVLDPRLALSPEQARVEAAIKTVRFPARVVNWDFELRSDATDDPAVYVDAFVEPAADAPLEERRAMLHELYETSHRISEALSAAQIQRVAYVRPRSVVDYKAG